MEFAPVAALDIAGNGTATTPPSSIPTHTTGTQSIYSGQVWRYQLVGSTYRWVNTNASTTNYNTVNVDGGGTINGTAATIGRTGDATTLLRLRGGDINSTVNLAGNNNTFAVTSGTLSQGNTVTVGTGTVAISGGNINGNITTNNGSSAWQLSGNAVVRGALTASASNNSILISNNVVFEAGSSLNVSGQNNTVRIRHDANFKAGSTITIRGGSNDFLLNLGQGSYSSIKLDSNGTINFHDRNNRIIFGNNTRITDATDINILGSGGNMYTFRNWSEFSAHWNIVGDSNQVNIIQAAEFHGAINLTGGNNTLAVGVFDFNDAATPLTDGQVVFKTNPATNTDHKNTVNIHFGMLTNKHGSIISSNTVDTEFTISNDMTYNHADVAAGQDLTVNLLVSGANATKSTYVITGGDVFNIRQATDNAAAQLHFDSTDEYWKTDYTARNDLTGSHTIRIGGGEQHETTYFQSYSLLNIDTLSTSETANGNKTIISLGGFKISPSGGLGASIKNQGAAWGQGEYGNQLTVKNLEIGTNSKLIIHEDVDRFGKTLDPAENEKWNIADETNVLGELTIDRGSIHSSAYDGSARLNVGSGAILYGFGEYKNAADHDPLRAQLYGTLTLARGATLQPYDTGLSSDYYSGGLPIDNPDVYRGLFASWNYDESEAVRREHRGAVFQVDGVGSNGGDTIFGAASIFRSRLFDDGDDRKVLLAGESEPFSTQFSDSLLTISADFQDVFDEVNSRIGWDAQATKVQYDAVFGFHYDVASKQEFKLYETDEGDGKTYYYSVVNGSQAITQLDGYSDANHLFNHLILKSDMLGQYTFLKEDGDTGIYLRYRMLVHHPTVGGIKRSMEEQRHRNGIKPAQYLDEIRYPFSQPGSDLNVALSWDPSLSLSYNDAGYNGSMWGDGDGFYAKTANPLFDNIREEWIKDWENLFQGMQLGISSNANLYRAVRMLHAETYANISQTSFDVMNQFVRNRERNAISALFLVEADNPRAVENETVTVDQFVRNPIRFWSSGWGSYGHQMEHGGSKSGYDVKIRGGSVGAIKELGDYYIGTTIGYAHTKNEYDNSATKIKTYLAEVLLGARVFRLGFAELYGGYSYNENSNTRVVDLASDQLGGYYGVAKGEYVGHVINGGFRLGYQGIVGGGWLFVPSIGFNVMHYRNESFTEGGRSSMANRMSFNKKAMDRTLYRVPVEYRLSRLWALGGEFVLAPEVRAGVSLLLGDRSAEARAQWVGNPINNRYFHSEAARSGRLEGWIGATVELSRRGCFYIAGNYDYIYSNDYRAHNYSLQAGWNF